MSKTLKIEAKHKKAEKQLKINELILKQKQEKESEKKQDNIDRV